MTNQRAVHLHVLARMEDGELSGDMRWLTVGDVKGIFVRHGYLSHPQFSDVLDGVSDRGYCLQPNEGTWVALARCTHAADDDCVGLMSMVTTFADVRVRLARQDAQR